MKNDPRNDDNDWVKDVFNRPPDVVVTVDDAICEGILIPATFSIPPGRVRLGFIVISDGVHALVDGNHEELRPFLVRHRDGDGGEIAPEDVNAHDDAVVQGGWLMSVYHLRDQPIWIITERDRRTTTVLLPSQY